MSEGHGTFRAVVSLLLLIATGKVFASSNENAWTFGITPDAMPLVRTTLLRFPRDEFSGGITLVHELVFDGCRYASRMVLPELESYLISGDPEEFKWRSLNEQTISYLSLGKQTRVRNRVWVLTKLMSNRYRIASTDGMEVYDYANCLLVRALIENREYHFEHTEKRLSRVIKINPILDDKLVCIEYNRDGLMSEMRAAGKILKFKYGKNLELLSCVDWFDDSKQEEVISCAYRDGLLVKVNTAGEKKPFLWGHLSITQYANPSIVPPPVIVGDGQFNYRAEESMGVRTIYFQALDGTSRGKWELEFKTGLIHVSIHTKQ